jgi:hypothetical protein
MYPAYKLIMYPTQSSQFFQAEYTFGWLNEEDRYHNHVIRSRLIRSIAAIFDQTRDEVVEAWKEFMPVASDGM